MLLVSLAALVALVAVAELPWRIQRMATTCSEKGAINALIKTAVILVITL
jgi:hypothetical protein